MSGPAETAAGNPDRIGTGTLLADRYLVQEVAGYGGMAMVYRGRDTLLDRDVAIKVLNQRLGAEGDDRAAFLREARAAASLANPGIVGTYDAGVFAGWPFIVMEFVRGGSVKDLLDREQRLPPEQAVAIAAAMADALDYGHQRGLVHCDVKPQNILLDEGGKPKLVDFGIAQTAAATVALTQAVSGTAGYVAPEQLEGLPLDGRADIYSLGTVLYQMLAGALPFQAPNVAALATRRLVADPRPLREVNPSISPQLAAVVMRALARYPGERFTTAAEFARVLRATQQGEPIDDYATEPLRGARFVPEDDGRTQTWQRTAAGVPAPFERGSPFPLIAAVLAVAVLVLALGLFALVQMNGSAGSATVPSVQGQRLDDATKQLQSAGLKINVQIEASSQPPGTVLSQDPAATTRRAKSNPVNLVVSGGPSGG